jgi:hypothetical protein
MRLPNAENAVIDIAKLRDYSLNPDHPEGKHKARAFQAKLGFGRGDAERLRQLIFEAILTAEATEQQPIEYGRRFTVEFRVLTSEGAGVIGNDAVVRTAWIIRNDENFPRLTTCFNPYRSR